MMARRATETHEAASGSGPHGAAVLTPLDPVERDRILELAGGSIPDSKSPLSCDPCKRGECVRELPWVLESELILVKLTNVGSHPTCTGHRFDGAAYLDEELTVVDKGTGCPHAGDHYLAVEAPDDEWWMASSPARLK